MAHETEQIETNRAEQIGKNRAEQMRILDGLKYQNSDEPAKGGEPPTMVLPASKHPINIGVLLTSTPGTRNRR